ncbi:hypothetical protein KBZ12_13920 [Cyanobium sp. Cruz CV13-4-11]|uniref:hypothetical protein n=1 Tax=unclassified Cyanobium TaxID=2627006 RepID=UPI0020CF163F|nr:MULTISPECIES: hypothetical protein [unclassified Cyanobium]MCP9920554.1 hypothetical protein [Cyanobium sp. Cruz CV13-4-11]
MSVTRIQPRRRFSLFEWKEIVEYRDLLYYLSLRDIKLRYKQTSLGAVWVGICWPRRSFCRRRS